MNKFWSVLKKPKLIITRLYQIVFNLIGYLPVKKDLIIFESFLGKQYSCNPRAIYEYLIEHNNNNNYKLFWSVDRRYKEQFEDLNIPTIYRFSVKWLFLMPRANYWVLNSRMPNWIRKPKHTVYLQTWHGTPLKKLAGDIEEVHMPGTSTISYKEGFYKEAQRWDYLISPNSYSTEIFRRAFRFENKILETGYPRNDYLINKNTIENVTRIKKNIGVPENKRVILYAPTWRDDEYFAKGHYKFNLNIEFDKLKQTLGDQFVIILRMHYLIANKIDVSQYGGFVLDASSHNDISELYLITDMLITDYSSVFFDYMCLKRPIIFYTYDIDSYRDKLRGFYFDFENEAPGPLVKTTEELIKEIKLIISSNFEPSDVLMSFHKRFCSLEKGLSTERVVKSVFLERE